MHLAGLRARTSAVLLLIAAWNVPAALAQGTAASGQIHSVAWIAGCWQAANATRVIDEYWMPPRAGMMMGMARTAVRDSVRETESTMIRERPGILVYEAHPSGQAMELFPSIVVNADSVVFENKAHDFPQRIGYVRRGTDSLVAWIEGTSSGKTRHIPYEYKRAACPR